MRNERDFEDAGLVLVVIALVLMIAVVVAIADRRAGEQQFDPFLSVEPSPGGMGFTSPLLGPTDPLIRVNELPQIQ